MTLVWVQKLSMDQYANCGTIVFKVCNLKNHEKSEKHQQWAPIQGQQDLIQISKKISNDVLVIWMFHVTKE